MWSSFSSWRRSSPGALVQLDSAVDRSAAIASASTRQRTPSRLLLLGAVEIRPTQQRAGAPSSAPGLLLSQEAGVFPCSSGHRLHRASRAPEFRRPLPHALRERLRTDLRRRLVGGARTWVSSGAGGLTGGAPGGRLVGGVGPVLHAARALGRGVIDDGAQLQPPAGATRV